MRQHLPGKLQLTEAERAAMAFAADPAEEKADHLPHRVEAEAARHHRIVLEMTAEEPEVRLHVELGADQPPAVLAAGFGNLADAIEHQHRRQRQLGVAGAEQLAPAASQQILVFITAAPIQHPLSASQCPDKARWPEPGSIVPREPEHPAFGAIW